MIENAPLTQQTKQRKQCKWAWQQAIVGGWFDGRRTGTHGLIFTEFTEFTDASMFPKMMLA